MTACAVCGTLSFHGWLIRGYRLYYSGFSGYCALTELLILIKVVAIQFYKSFSELNLEEWLLKLRGGISKGPRCQTLHAQSDGCHLSAV